MKRYRASYLLALIAVAVLASAGSASAAKVSVEAGPLAAAADSDPLVHQALQRSQEIASDARTRSQLLIDQARSTLDSATRSTMSSARLLYRNRLGRADRILRKGLRRARRARAWALYRASRLRADALVAQEQALGRARSSTDGAYALVSGSGRIIDQRGGVFVWHPGTGIYVLTFASEPGCGNVGASLPFHSTLGNVGLRADSGDAITVLNRNAKGALMNGAFYLAISC